MTDARPLDAYDASQADDGRKDYDRSLRTLSRIAAAVVATFVFAVILFLLLFQWNWLRGPIGSAASARLEREVRLVGNLDVALLRAEPEARIEDLRVADAAWRNADRPMAQVQRLVIRTRWTDLLTGRVTFPLIQADRPVVALFRDAQGRENWKFSDEPDDGEPTDIPPINNLVINDGRLSVRDQGRNLSLDATMNSSERVSAGGEGRCVLAGQGRIRSEPFSLNVAGGPLVNVRRDRPYPLTADIRAGATRLTARGQIDRPFNLGQLRAALTLQGPDLSDVYDVTGLALPNTPPYRISGSLVRDGRVFTFNGFRGEVGDSDLSGDIRVETGGERPQVTASLRSRRLDFDDLLAVVGGPPDPNETANASQRAQSASMRAERRMMPDATLDTARFRAVDAEVTYEADAVNAAANLPLRSVAFHVTLEDGLLTADRLAFGFPQGEISGTVSVNGRGATPVSEVDLRVRGVRIEGLVPVFQGSKPVEGPIMARIRLRGSGASARRAAAASSGRITAVIPTGRVRRSLAELSAVSVLPGLLQLLSRDESETPLSCAVADFRVQNGIGTAQTLAVDTGVATIRGSGTISLRDESMNLHFDGDSKRPRILRVFAPFNVRGRFLEPQFDVEVGPAVAQTGIAAALGALVSPLAAILPFLEPGEGEQLNCAQLESQAAARGAPTRASR